MSKVKSKTSLNPSEIKNVVLRQSQKLYLDTIEENDIALCFGPAGSSKTFTAVYAALKLYTEKKIDKIILTKPIQESGEKLGFLPGSVEEKIDPFMESFINNAIKIIDGQTLGFLISTNVIEFRPLAYMRGATFDRSIMILDEAQNCDFRQLMLFITRMGQESKVVVTGDVSQYDINKSKVALPEFIKLIEDVKGVGKHIFTEKDIVRSKILQEVVKKYEKWKHEKDEF
jgi:phosphate starvation-inducible PhoH-like protein